MLEALHKIEIMSISLSFEAMIILGAVLLGVGLCVWFGGLLWHFLSAILSGIFAGLVSATFTPDQYQIKAFGIAAVAIALIVLIFRKRSLVFIAALIVVFSGLFIAALPAMNASTDWQVPPLPEGTNDTELLTAADTFTVLADVLFSISGSIGTHIKGLSAGSYIIPSIAGFVVLIVGFIFARIVSAISCSMLGTFFVFTGMIVLLLQKGSMPLNSIYHKPVFYQTIIICMIIFGSVCGLFLCPMRRRKPDREDKKTEKKNAVT